MVILWGYAKLEPVHPNFIVDLSQYLKSHLYDDVSLKLCKYSSTYSYRFYWFQARG